MNTRPPYALRLLARLVVPAPHREFVLGDLNEMFAHRAARKGRLVAALWFGLDTIVSAWAGLRARSRRSRAPHGGSPNPGPRIPRRGDSGLVADLAMAIRSVRSEFPLVALAVVTLGLGVGTTAAVFGMADQILLRPLAGVGDADEAAYLQFYSVEAPERTQGVGISTLDFDDLRASATLLEGIASFGYTDLKVSLGNERPISVTASTVYGDYFETLRVRPAAGRLLSARETELGTDPLRAVLGEKLARDLFGSVDAAVAASLQLNGETVPVIGVAGDGFAGAERGIDVDMWLPYGALVPLVGFDFERLVDRNSVMHNEIVVRPRTRVTEEAVLEQVDGIRHRLSEADNPSGPYLAELRPRLFSGLHIPPLVRARTYSALRLMGLVVGLVLLLACANVANLLLFRNVRRRGVVATLRALGASTGRIARQQLALSLVIGALGAMAGLGIGWLVAFPFKGASLVRMPPFEGLVLDGRVALFGAGLSVLTAILFGALPAILAGRFDLAGSLRSSSGRETGRTAKIRSTLSTLQLSAGLALVVGALLLVRTMQNLYTVDLGLDTENVVTMSLNLPRGIELSERDLLYDNLITTVGAIPEVSAAAIDPYGPNSGASLLGRISLPDTPADEALRASLVAVTPGWFDVVGASIVGGRTFRREDWNVGSPAPVILTESLARRLFGRADVVGQRVSAGFVAENPVEIIGVIGDIRSPRSPDEPTDMFFLTPDGLPFVLPMTTLVIRVPSFDPAVRSRIRNAVEGVLSNEPVPDPVPVAERLNSIYSEARVYSRLLTLLAVVAVLLAAVGLYGVIAFNVTSRRREFGIRLAMGAQAHRIVQLVARNAAGIVIAGSLLGFAGAYALSRLLESRLFGVTPFDPASYAVAALIFALVAAVACWAPTRRALGVDPVTTLREE